MKDRADVRADLMLFKCFKRGISQEDFARHFPLIESGNQAIQTTDQRCLPAAAFSRQDKALALVDLQIDVP